MIVKNNILLRNAPPLAGSEIVIFVDGVPTELTDGYTFGINRIYLSGASEKLRIEWGDGTIEFYGESVQGVTHTYAGSGVYRVRISDDAESLMVSAGGASVFPVVYAPMVREFRTNAAKMTFVNRTAFRNAINIRSVELRGSAVRSISSAGFYDCSALTDLDGFRDIETLSTTVFHGCSSLAGRVDFPNLTAINASVGYSPFGGTAIKEFHFAAKHEEAIKALQIYTETGGNLGVEGAVCFFDL